MKLTNFTQSLKNILAWHLTIRWAILLITTGLFILILYPSLFTQQPSYHLGDIASRNVKAPREFFIEDEAATEIRRIQAAKDVLTVYDHDVAMVTKRCAQVRRAFDSIRQALAGQEKAETLPDTELFNTGLPDLVVKSGLSIKDEPVLKTGPMVKKIKTPAAADKLSAQKELFIRQIGIPVSDGAYRILEKEHFSSEISSAIHDIFQRIMNNGVVARKEILLKEGDRGIILRNLETKTEKTVHSLKHFYGLDQAKTMVRIVGEPILNTMNYNLRNLVVDFVQEMIRPNITLNRSETADRRKLAAAEVKPVVTQIKAGEMILREGEPITRDKLAKIKVLQQQNRSQGLLLSGVGASIIMLCLMLCLYALHNYRQPINPDRNRDIFCLASIFLTILVIARLSSAISDTLIHNLAYDFSPLSIYLAAPLVTGAMTVCLLIGLNVAVSFSLMTAVAVALIFQSRLEIFVFFFISGTLAAYWVKDCRERKVFIKTGLKVGLLNILLVTAIKAYLDQLSGTNIIWDWLFVFSGGLFSGIFAAGLVPFFETTFGYSTDIKLLELANLDRPILRRLMIEAPGTYHHSVIVGSMVEAAASDIGANPLLAKVCGYYHDIGKIEKPLYFIENQSSSMNRHDKLAPSMSKRILISHVKEGVNIATEHKLGQPIIDTIIQHHGTSVISYFYEKEKKLKGELAVSADDFRYPGPRPQTREAGLVMLADMLEAASRTLSNPTPSRIQGLVQRLINQAFSEGQLDQCELTLKDLNRIAKRFNKFLNGIHHHRIEYPEKSRPEKFSAATPKTVKTRADNGNGKSNRRHRQSPDTVRNFPPGDKKDRPKHLRRLGIS
ncbi:MAG: HD family phosphohydrolase [Deltaproteobacteria bacterium]|nr:MAG: HD family phosphohydrolase [Deltaproteobacteria bacterium]